jgi:hypothetical protein
VTPVAVSLSGGTVAVGAIAEAGVEYFSLAGAAYVLVP